MIVNSFGKTTHLPMLKKLSNAAILATAQMALSIKSSHGCPPNNVRTRHGARWASIVYDALLGCSFGGWEAAHVPRRWPASALSMGRKTTRRTPHALRIAGGESMGNVWTVCNLRAYGMLSRLHPAMLVRACPWRCEQRHDGHGNDRVRRRILRHETMLHGR